MYKFQIPATSTGRWINSCSGGLVCDLETLIFYFIFVNYYFNDTVDWTPSLGLANGRCPLSPVLTGVFSPERCRDACLRTRLCPIKFTLSSMEPW